MPFEDPALTSYLRHQAALTDAHLSHEEWQAHFTAMGRDFDNIGKTRIETPPSGDKVSLGEGGLDPDRLRRKYSLDPKVLSTQYSDSQRWDAGANLERERLDGLVTGVSHHKLKRFDRKVRMAKALMRGSAKVLPRLKPTVKPFTSELDEHRDNIVKAYRRANPAAPLTVRRKLPQLPQTPGEVTA